MRHDEGELVLAGLGENGGEGVGDEILELVDVEIEAPALGARHIGAGHRGHVHLVHENKAQKLRVHIADLSLAQVHQKHLAAVHHFADVESGFRLPDDVAHRGVRDEGTELRAEVRDHFLFFALSGLCNFVLPEASDDHISAFADLVLLEFLVHEEPGHVDERGALFFVVHQRKASVAKVVLNARTEDLVAEELQKDFHRVERGAVFLFGCLGLEKIESHRALAVGRIKHDDVFGALLRRVRERILDEVAVRIHDAEPVAVRDILA